MTTAQPTTKINTFGGFDYSMSCPALCILGSDGTWQTSTTYFLTEKKKYQNVFGTHKGFQVIGEPIPLWDSPEERWYELAMHFSRILQPVQHDEWFVALEDYSMGSKGKVFHIAENTGILKHMLWKCGYKFVTVPPTQIKKYATGKGNAKKEQMRDAFLKDTGVDLSKIMGQDGKLDSPVTDVIDAYYIAKYAKVLHEQSCQRPEVSKA